MLHRSLPLLFLLLVVASLLVADANGGGGRRGRRTRHHRDPRVYDARPSEAEHDDADDDEDDGDDHDGDDHHDDDKDDDDHHDDEGGRHRGAGHHDDEHEHDPTYDHESFLGRDESHRYDELSPRQAKNSLLDLLPKIDANNDTKISMDEMQLWLAAIAKRERRLSADKKFDAIKLFNHALDVNAPMTFDEYKTAAHQSTVGSHEGDRKSLEDFNAQMVRDQARWTKADVDGDKALSRAEFVDFLRPEEAPHMREVVIQEVMMSADKNKDGKVDINEFMSDLRPTYEADVRDKKRLPRWIQKEEKRFKEKLDTNKDGSLDPNEIYAWIVPEDFDHSRKETRHLFKIADKDNDKHLTRDEVLDKWASFVGHKADTAMYPHEEL